MLKVAMPIWEDTHKSPHPYSISKMAHLINRPPSYLFCHFQIMNPMES